VSSKKSTSKAQKARYSEYKAGDTARTNRTMRLERHVKNHPQDKQSKNSLKKGLAVYRRYASKNGVWNATNRYYAQLFTKAGLNGNDSLPKKETNKT